MTKIAFLGLGRMGSPMARRLIFAGHTLVVWNRTKAKTEPLVEAGARAEGTPAEAVADCDLVITMLTDLPAVDEVLFGADGAAQRLVPGTVLVEMSTIGPQAVAKIRSKLITGVGLVDAPVKGSIPAASSGTLTILVGGASEYVAACQEVLSVLGTVHHLGPSGTGAAVKLLANIVLCSSYVMIGEALALGDRLGLDTDIALNILAETAIGDLIPGVRAELTDPDEPTHFSLGLAEKDLRLALAAGAAPDGLVAAARAQLAAGLRDGLGDKNLSAVLHHIRRGLVGVSDRKP